MHERDNWSCSPALSKNPLRQTLFKEARGQVVHESCHKTEVQVQIAQDPILKSFPLLVEKNHSVTVDSTGNFGAST